MKVSESAAALTLKNLRIGLDHIGFYLHQVMLKIKWGVIRVFFYLVIAITLLTGGLFTYIAAPVPSIYVFNDLRFWKYIKYFHKINIQLYRVFFIWLTDPGFRASYAQPLTSPPLSGPDRKNVRLSKSWIHGESSCSGCVKCCVKIKCPLHDNEKCLSYNSPFWRYFSCGRYPVSQSQIDYYGCEKWEMKFCKRSQGTASAALPGT